MADPKPCSIIGSQKVFHLSIGRVGSCCNAYSEELDSQKTINDYIVYWQKQRHLLDQGIQIPQCEVCWKAESQNKISYRQQNLNVSTQQTSYELSISNACNQILLNRI